MPYNQPRIDQLKKTNHTVFIFAVDRPHKKSTLTHAHRTLLPHNLLKLSLSIIFTCFKIYFLE